MFTNLPYKLAVFLKDNSETEKYTLEELEYGNKILLNTLGVLFCTIVPASLLGWFSESIIVLFNFALLRFFSGGRHIESSILCITVSSVIMLSIISINNLTNIDEISYIMSFITVIIMLLFAPNNIDSHLKLRIKSKTLFKLVSITIILFNIFIIKSELICLTYFIQGLTIIDKRRN